MPEGDELLSNIDDLLEEEAFWREYRERNWEQEAMRWHDEPEPRTRWTFEPNDASAGGSVVVLLTADTSAFEAAMREAQTRINATFARLTEAMRPFSQALGRLVEKINAIYGPKPRYDEHHPEPLAFHGRPFGAEYARRRKTRGRRG